MPELLGVRESFAALKRSPEPLVWWFWKEHEMLTRESKAIIVLWDRAKP